MIEKEFIETIKTENNLKQTYKKDLIKKIENYRNSLLYYDEDDFENIIKIIEDYFKE